MFNQRDLQALAIKLQPLLGEYWTIKVYSAKECAETGVFDPPCTYLEATCALGSFLLDKAGEISTDVDIGRVKSGQVIPDILAFLKAR